MRRGAWLWISLVVAAASCGGGPLSEKSLQKEAEAIRSLSGEGALLAGGVVEGRTTDVYVRVHSGYLQKEAGSIQSKLASESASGTLESRREKATRLAGRVAEDLAQLHRAPDDRTLADRLRSQLLRIADAAEQLAT